MNLADEITKLRPRAERAMEYQTEEAAKNALIMPMLRALGYDVFDPEVVVPEFTSDVGIKKGEKVDYAIKINSKITMLIECKPSRSDLSKEHASQLYRYFSVTESRFGILTNGLEWRFFTDLDAPNKMDAKPFFIFSLLDHNELDYAELEKFSAPNFSVEGILGAASDLKLRSLLMDEVRREMSNPSEELVRLIGKRVYEGNLTAETRARLATLLVVSFQEVMRDQANQRLKSAIDRAVAPEALAIATTPPASDAGLKTTEDELEAYRIIRAISRQVVSPDRIAIRDAASYCAVLFDDNNRRPIARLYLEGSKRRIGLFSNKIETRYDLSDLSEIYNHSDALVSTIREYI
jgi:hypothetical protein